MRVRVMSKYVDKPTPVVLGTDNLTDMEKLSLIFDKTKDSMKERYPDLYYAILGVLDNAKKPIVTPICNLSNLLGVKEGIRFTCNGYYYKIEKFKIFVNYIDGWKECGHAEVAAVVAKRDEIKVCDDII